LKAGSEGRAKGVRRTRLWAQLLGVLGVIVGGIEVEEDDDGEIAGLIVSARLRKAEAGRCGVHRRRSGGARPPPYLNLPGEESWPVIAASDIIT
jgi:hypothetical protein